MIVKNISKNTILAADCKVADTFISRFIGLMGKSNLPNNSGLLIIPCNSIHMFFMKFPIDVVFLSKESKVVHIIEGISPWHVSKIVSSAHCVLELPTGTVRQSKTSLGDTLEYNF